MTEDAFDIDHDLFMPNELRRYHEIAAYLKGLDNDEDVRLLVEMPVLMTKITLRAISRMVTEFEAKKQAIDARADAIEERFAQLEQLITKHTQLLKDGCWELTSKSLVRHVMDEIQDTLQAELHAFLESYRKSEK